MFALSPDGNRLLFGSDKSILTVLDRQTNSISTYSAVGSRVRTLVYTRDARFIIAITDDRHLNLWDTQHHYQHCSWSIGDREAITILPHPIQSQLLLIATEDGYIATVTIFNKRPDDAVLTKLLTYQYHLPSIALELK